MRFNMGSDVRSPCTASLEVAVCRGRPNLVPSQFCGHRRGIMMFG